MQDEKAIRDLAQSLLSVPTSCLGHCEEPAEFEFIDRDGMQLSCLVCPDRYVSRVISYGKEGEPVQLKNFVQEATPEMGTVEDGDIRVGSRYAWDLGLDTESDDLVMKETYWTQNYRRTRSDRKDRPALFLCSNRDSLFVQPLTSQERLCSNCRK